MHCREAPTRSQVERVKLSRMPWRVMVSVSRGVAERP